MNLLIQTFDTSELIKGFETSSVEPVVGLEGNSEEVSFGFNCLWLFETAMARQLSVNCLVVGELDVIAGRLCRTSVVKKV